MTPFDTDLTVVFGRMHYAPLAAKALELAPAEAAHRFGPWCVTHLANDATRAAASHTWFHTVLIRTAMRGSACGDAVALDFLRFAKLGRTTLASAAWMGTPWLKAIRARNVPPAEGWRLAEGVGLGLFRWDWSSLGPPEVRMRRISPRRVWLLIVTKSESRVHELSESFGDWLSAFPRLHAAAGMRETQKYRRACADRAKLGQARKLGLIVRIPESSFE